MIWPFKKNRSRSKKAIFREITEMREKERYHYNAMMAYRRQKEALLKEWDMAK